MLDITTKTIKQIEMLGVGGLEELVKEYYNLNKRWELCDGNNGDMRLFDITQEKPVSDTYPYFADVDMNYALTVIKKGIGEEWDDVEAVLARLCYDSQIPQGYYLVKLGW